MSVCSHPNQHLHLLFAASDYITGDSFHIALCPGCGNTITTPQPTDLSRYYPESYYGSTTSRRFPAVVEWLQSHLYGGRARRVEQQAGRAGKVLDIGCGRGLLLEAFRRRGWVVHGTEFSDHAAAHATQMLKIAVSIGDITQLELPAGQFDAITMWHVLEHVRDPRLSLNEAFRLLKPEGVLFVGVPNLGGWEARVCRDKWFHLDVPRHLVHFPKGRLELLLRETGFDLVEVSGFAPEYDLFSFVQSIQNRIGLRHNLLYSVLRRGAAKVLGPRGASPLQVICAIGLGALLGLAAIPWIVLAGVFRQGGTLTLLARKRTPSGV